MASFTNVIANVVTTLQTDASLTSFCATKWGKALKVMKAYKKRIEVNLNDLPVILITRPSLDKEFLVGVKDADNVVRLYCLFHQTDREKALDEMIEFEELIDDALMADHTRGGTAINTNPNASANDEGEYHPVYALAMDVAIKHRR